MNKSDRCIEELYSIIRIEGINHKDGLSARQKALERWINDWIVDVEINQSIIKNKLNSEELDYLKYHAAKVASEELMKDCINVNLNKNNINIRVRSIKRV